jgi:hypothetical protein
MERTATFTISNGTKGYDIKCKAFNAYNRYNLAKDEIFTAMEQISDVFNNVLEIAVVFDVE